MKRVGSLFVFSIGMLLIPLIPKDVHSASPDATESPVKKSLHVLTQHDPDTVRAVLLDEVPGLIIKSLKIISTGWDNLVADVNNEWIFRFARKQEFVTILEREKILLDWLHQRISLPIPYYEMYGKHTAFVGYRKIQGETLLTSDDGDKVYCTFSEQVRQEMAEKLALFLSELHQSVNVADAADWGYKNYEIPLQLIEDSFVGTLASPDVEKMIQEAVMCVKENSFPAHRRVLLHNDLHGENFTLDTKTLNVSGVFDFSDAGIGDYTMDFGKFFNIHHDLAIRTIKAYARLRGVDNFFIPAAANHILRRAAYMLQFRDEGDDETVDWFRDALGKFVPIWNDLLKKNFVNKKGSLVMEPKKSLVTGGAGFLGSHLCKALLDLGHQVIAIDNLYTGRLSNIQELLADKNFTFINHDITGPIDLAVDWIFNFACPASPPHYQKDPLFTTKTSVLGILNMLELARKNNARIMQASTSEVYGNPLQHPQPESYLGNVSCTGPRACYDEGKRCAESLMFDYNRMYATDIKVIRIFNTYGPNMDPDDGRVVSNFIMQALNNQPITMYGDGTQTRSFCYVDDLIAGIIAMMHSDATITGPVNLGNPVEFTLLELAAAIQKSLGTQLPLQFKPLPQDDPLQRKPDISMAKNVLGWEPKVDLQTGLEKTITYFAQYSVQQKKNTIISQQLS